MTTVSMRAAVLVGVGRVEVRDVPRPEPAAREVRLRVAAVGLCGTDVHIVEGHANYHRDARGALVPLSVAPQILGHEIVGIVETVGAGVADLRAGDRVVVDQGRSCVSEGRAPLCEYCATGDSHQCERYAEHGITGLPGGLAEYIVVPAVNAIRVVSDRDAASLALTEPLGCIVHSTDALRRAGARYALGGGDGRGVRTVLLCGAGPSGLLFVQYLRQVLHFDGQLLVAEPNARKRALAERFGAEGIDTGREPLAEAVRERTRGRRVELLIDAAGAASVLEAIPMVLRKQGTVLLYGHGHAGVDASVFNGIQFLEPTMVSPAGASGGFEADGRPATYRRALRLIEEGVIDTASLVSHRYASLDAVPQAFAGDHRQPDYVKGVVVL